MFIRPRRFGKARRHILSRPAIDTKLNALFEYAGEHGIPLYVN